MRNQKRWLIDRLKSSGSRKRWVSNVNYSDFRNSKVAEDLEDLPKRESYKKSMEIYNGKINFGLFFRFLSKNVGKNWEIVAHEIEQRIPTRLKHIDVIGMLVATKLEYVDGKLWCKENHRFVISKPESIETKTLRIFKFYVDPITNLLVKNY
jgi:hypothetical protein